MGKAALYGLGWLLAMMVGTTCIGQTQSCDEIIGKWVNLEHTLKIEVYKAGGDFKARVIWFRDYDNPAIPMDVRRDAHNPDKSLRDRKVIGMDILSGVTYNKKENRWENGFIYDATTGRTWCSSATLSCHCLLKVRGYWKFQWIGKTITFTRL